MSLNDRCAEAHAVLHYGGTIPDVPEVRAALLDWLRDGYEYGGGPPRDLVHAIRDHPDNAELWERIRTGELPALYDERWTDQEMTHRPDCADRDQDDPWGCRGCKDPAPHGQIVRQLARPNGALTPPGLSPTQLRLNRRRG